MTHPLSVSDQDLACRKDGNAMTIERIRWFCQNAINKKSEYLPVTCSLPGPKIQSCRKAMRHGLTPISGKLLDPL